MSEAIRRIKLNVDGAVQGVGFRFYIARHAQELGVCGYVRNMPDGSVEIVAEGPENRLRALAEHAERGPSMSRVTDCDLEWAPASGEFTSFDIRRGPLGR